MKTILVLLSLSFLFVSCEEINIDDLLGQIEEQYSCVGKESNAPFAEGSGTESDPYMICSKAQFLEIENDLSYLDKHFKLQKNLDMTGETPSGIGDNTNRFEGVFDGNNKTISNYTLNLTGTAFVGMFRVIGVNATVKNLSVLNSSVTGGNYTGMLSGHVAGIVDNCHSSGTVTGGSRVGGLLGRYWKAQPHPIVTGSSSSATVNAGEFAGGLIGWVRGDVYDSHATGSVTASGNRLGGLIGIVDPGNIIRCYATGNVSGGYMGGGLVGGIGGSISKSYSTGTVNTGSWSGGLAGVLGMSSGSGSVGQSYSTSTVNGGATSVGGLVGYAYANYVISNSYYAGGSISGTDYVGGLAGTTVDTSINSYAAPTGITGSTFVGGLHGSLGVDVTDVFWDAELSGVATTYDASATAVSTNGETTANMQSSATYSAWDTTKWNIVDGQYPTLKHFD